MMKEINFLVKEARKNKGCGKGLQQLRNCTNVKDLIECFYDNIDYCLAKSFPSVDFLEQYRADLKKAGVYIDEDVTIHNPKRLVLIGNCNVTVKLTNWAVCRAYVTGTSRLNVETSAYAIMMADALGESKVKAIVNDPSKVIVNIYGNAQAEGATRVVLKEKETYDL